MTPAGGWWVGGYTAEMGGTAVGIAWWGADAPSPAVVPIVDPSGVPQAVSSPSFLALHPTLPVLYSADESAGTISAYRVEESPDGVPSLVVLGTRPAGAAVCHVAASPDGRHLVATCWGDGAVVLYPLDESGIPGAPSWAVAAEDTRAADRAAAGGPDSSSRSHMALWLGADEVVVTDLGYDLVRTFRVTGGALELASSVELPLGSGPRHLADAGGGILVVATEYSCEAVALVRRDGHFTIGSRIALTPEGVHPGETAAHIERSGDGFLTVGLRGSDRIAVLRCGVAGALERVGVFDSGGVQPRHHAVLGDRLVVAHQGSRELTVHRLAASGLSEGIIDRVMTGSPTVLLHAAPAPAAR